MWRPAIIVPAVATSLAALISVLIAGPTVAQDSRDDGGAQVRSSENARVIPDQYIVVFSSASGISGEGNDRLVGARAASRAAQERVKALGGKILHQYNTALIGFSVVISPEGLKVLRGLPGIEYIEKDQISTIVTIQTPAVAGIDRTSERLLPIDNRYTYSETGTGVHVYVLDTGIRATNVEFGARVSGGVSEIADTNGTNDCHGHGTNVAGIVGGTTYGIAKGVQLHPVRVLDCTGSGPTSGVIAGIDWVTANAVFPAVANLSLGGGISAAEDTAVNNSINAGITYVLAAGNGNIDACNTSPARVPNGITVGNVNPGDDRRRLVSATNGSNWGTCLDLFAPGVSIQAAGSASDTATSTFTGTSQAAPHVAGTAAKFLQNHTAATPAQVWAAIHAADDVTGTPGWAGIVDPNGSVNELLHWGSVNDGADDGDPHITTVNGIHYDFQAKGEFVALTDGGFELQTRQTPVPSQVPIFDSHTGLTSCVGVNTAAAMRIGSHRVSYQPGSRGMELRLDGAVTTIPAAGLTLGGGGRISPIGAGASDGVQVEAPDGSAVSLLSAFWGAPHNVWLLNVSVAHTRAEAGIMGAIASGEWLPFLANGTSLGPIPAGLAQRYAALYGPFARSWRVSNSSSLFDYAPGTSTATFTDKDWPRESGNCAISGAPPPLAPLGLAVAQRLCVGVLDKRRRANCVADVRATGHRGFAQLYLKSQRAEAGLTRTTLSFAPGFRRQGVASALVASVSMVSPRNRKIPQGSVQFFVGGEPVGPPVALGPSGRASWRMQGYMGARAVVATFIPAEGSGLISSSSF